MKGKKGKKLPRRDKSGAKAFGAQIGRLFENLQKAGEEGLSFSGLQKKLKLSDGQLERLLETAVRAGSVKKEDGRYYLARRRVPLGVTGRGKSLIGELVRLKPTFGFVRVEEKGENRDIFIPGSKLRGALPGDKVELTVRKEKDGLESGEITRILEMGSPLYAGIVRKFGPMASVELPGAWDGDLPLKGAEEAENGERVLVEILRRGESHRDYQARLVKRYGDGDMAVHCAQSILEAAGIVREFPEEAVREAKFLAGRGILPEELDGRLDLREEVIFTIDGAESKDLDDAVSIRETGNGFSLGVHIADVSHYVEAGSALDREAFRRGTSVYYADQVVPMLPEGLSNGICSLNPGEDRLAFSALMELDGSGKLCSFRFVKSVIRSRVKGVYSEVNRLLGGEQDPALLEKYRDVRPLLPVFHRLYALREGIRAGRGVPEIDSAECKLLIGDDGRCQGVAVRERGEAERMIEEFMLLANESAASVGRSLGLPFVYRVHEKPDGQKLETLRQVLLAVGEDPEGVTAEMPAGKLREILLAAEDKPYRTMLHRQVLRSMMKAKYDPRPIGHYGLVLQNYAHFTSPIRRYPDLAIHRILSAALAEVRETAEGWGLDGRARGRLERQFTGFAASAAAHSSETELQAASAERDCEDCYKAEFMKGHLGECFPAVISGVTAYGFYAELANGVEGLVRIESLPAGEYTFDGVMTLIGPGVSYRVGDGVTVRCVRADVGSGQVDFQLVRDDG